MYNRYIPQPDGSYRRTRHPDRTPPNRHPQPSPPNPPQIEPCPSPPPPAHSCPQRPCQQERRNDGGIKDFFKNILPKDFDTGDLLIVLLLLLMAGDCAEDQNTALLTLALYFIM